MTNENRGLDAHRRVDLAREPAFFLGSTEIRPATREVIGAGGGDVIEPRVMQVLVALARARGAIITRDDLTASCWDGRVVSEDAINRVISKLRRLSETAGGFTLETVTKVGYRLAVRVDEAHAAPTPPTAGLSAGEALKRLAIVVALDAAGYSHQSEVDDAVAVREIAALANRVEASAAAHGGRVFNTAGDGFMLEFASAAGAVACVEELLANSRVPLRAGMHLGDVAVAPDGDLLGHGVNVAARLQALAAPGELIASGDVKRAVSGRLANRLVRRGEVKLDKMDLRVETFALSNPWKRRSSAPDFSALLKRPVTVAIAALAAAVIVVGAFVILRPAPALPSMIGSWFAAQHAPPHRLATVALFPFTTAADPDSRYFADGLGVSLAQALDQTGILVAATPDDAAARQANATFLVRGDVRRDGAMLHVTVRVEDAARGVLLLTKTFDGTTAQTATLRDRIAADIVDSGGAYLTWRSDQPPEVTAALFRMREKSNANDRLGAYEIARAMAENAPNSAVAQISFASSAGFALQALPAAERQRTAAAARAAAERGHALDARIGEYWLVSAFLMPVVNWSEREATLRRATDDPHDTSFAPAFLGSNYRNAGRLREARVQIERAVARDPTSPDEQGELIDILVMLGENEEANAILDRDARLWPRHFELTHGRFDTAISHDDVAQADTLLRDAIAGPQLEPREGPQLMHLVVRALRTRSAADIAALASQCAHADTVSRGAARNCLVALTHLGQLDAAFTLAAGMYPDQRASTPEAAEQRWLETRGALHASAVMFYPDMASFRADPRFIAIVERLGLLAYWRKARHPPDFCLAEPAPVCSRLH